MKAFRKLITIPLFLLSALVASSEFYTPKDDLESLQKNKKEDAALPNVLLLGDSISIGYTPTVVELLDGKANVSRPTNKARVNCGDTERGLKDLDKWLGDKKWDVIHFNWGLHDLCYRHPDAKVYGKRDKINGTVSVPVEKYQENLEQLVERLEKTGAILIWASTTRVPEGEAGRFVGDDVKYNAAAKQVMDKHEVTINDLHALTASFGPSLFSKPGDVHFSKAGSEQLAAQVASEISKALDKLNTPKE
ncbi:GDSL-type esterase/lipase family protein [Rubritalea spongiae]|uniref:GDSL-type esterase/lipase family protein n=1 Tax=Rubritalea spongiae TaxID=430797 RepID=A0ABW5E2P1_9BACT